MAHDYERTKEKLARTEARLLKALEERKRLEAELKELRVQEERERLISRGEMLEKHLQHAELLTNAEIASILEIAFSLPVVQRRLNELYAAEGRQLAEQIPNKDDRADDDITA